MLDKYSIDFKNDRIGVKKLDVIDYFEKHEIQFISANESIVTSTPFGKAMLGIIGVIAELEIETTKDRTQAGKAQARDRGVYMGTIGPFGYMKKKDKQLVILEEEAKAVREIFDLFVVQKKNTQQIADYLKAMNILTPLPSSIHYGKRKPGITKINEPYFWRDTTVRDILKDEIYIGLYYYNKNEGNKRVERSKWVLSPFRHNPIIDRSVYSLAQRRIEEEISLRDSQKSLDNHLYLLSGLVKCHTFYDAYSGREPLNWFGTSKKKDGTRMYYYSCGGKNGKKHSTICPAIPFPAEEIEGFVSEFIKDLLNDPESVCRHVDLLESTKANKKHLERLQKHVIDELNGIPDYKVPAPTGLYKNASF